MFDLLTRGADGAGVPVPLPGRLMVFAGPDGLMVKDGAGNVRLYAGPDGLPGAPGADGLPGAPGAPGADGLPGAPGADGADGLPGAPGADGADGAPGAPGLADSDVAFAACPSAEIAQGGNVYVKVSLSNVLVNKGGGFDSALFRFVVPAGKGGLYLLGFTATIYAVSLGNFDARVRLNGADFMVGSRGAPIGSVMGVCTSVRVASLAAGDVLELFTWGTASANLRPLMGNNTVFSGYRIGSAS